MKKIEKIAEAFTVCRLKDFSQVAPDAPYSFTARTDKEYSLVCPTARVPENTLAREDGWRAFRVAGALDVSLVGILAEIASLLAEKGIALFAVSTYDTDYVLTKEESYAAALEALEQAGWNVS